jgi:hypothetical protein
MSNWYNKQPKNRNFLSPQGFKMEFEIFPDTEFFCQAVNFPDISVPFTEVPTRFRSFPIIGGGGVSYGDLQATFIIDEDMHNYAEIFNWIRNNGQSENTAPLNLSRAQLTILTSNFNANLVADFQYLFPYSLSQIQFDATIGEESVVTAQASFKYAQMSFRDKDFKVYDPN